MVSYRLKVLSKLSAVSDYLFPDWILKDIVTSSKSVVMVAIHPGHLSQCI